MHMAEWRTGIGMQRSQAAMETGVFAEMEVGRGGARISGVRPDILNRTDSDCPHSEPRVHGPHGVQPRCAAGGLQGVGRGVLAGVDEDGRWQGAHASWQSQLLGGTADSW